MKDLSLSLKDVQRIYAVLVGPETSEGYAVHSLHGDGSARRFFRLRRVNTSYPWPSESESLLAVLPPKTSKTGLSEAWANFNIGLHLHERGIPVPLLYGFDPGTGLLLFEDLGDTLLNDFVTRHGISNSMAWYKKAVDELIRFQVDGRYGFDSSWCYDTVKYDRQLMLARESGYFAERFWQGYLGQNQLPAGIWEEFEKLADRAALAPNDFLLHRDFQSRNLMIHQGELRIIDFQGTRLGPLAYDLAALLLDPYVNLGKEQRKDLLAYYIDTVAGKISLDRISFRKEYYYIALHRNLQILGAFGYLTKVAGKTFFQQYIGPALTTLGGLLRQSEGNEFPLLGRLTDRASDLLA